MPTAAKLSTYTFDEHKHRYAVWTVARAQRAFAKNKVIAEVMEKAELRSFVENTTLISQREFDKLHQQWCATICDYFPHDKCDYGRAAKMIAIYLKTVVVLPGAGESSLCDVIHPPIDRILLQNIARATSLKHFRTKNWTTLGGDAYWEIIHDIREHFGLCNWKLEAYWSVKDEEE
jgi:hypothetical protein